jgi:neutral ceramidase
MACFLNALLAIALASVPATAPADFQIGRGRADITGPAFGIQLWGFVKEGQVSEGIHFRQWSRAFVIADQITGKRIAFVSADIGSITHEIHLSVVERLRARFGELYGLENTILSATHTHAAPGGHWQRGASSPMGSGFVQEYYDVIVAGISDSIAAAHDDLRTGEILIHHGIVENAGANRSLPAYLNNPETERARYDADTDREMTLLKLMVADDPIGVINWFAVHPTAMTYNNRLISGDQKGHASYLMESTNGSRDGRFVAAFAQSNCGDVTPNLNLNNTGPGDNEFETTRIIAERQVAVAQQLFDSATERLTGPVDYRQCFVDMRYRPVAEKFTGVPAARTCPSAYGYAFAAGSTEDGGGHPMFREGMLVRNPLIDGMVKQQLKVEPPSEECRECHGNKVILITTGETKPEPSYTQVVSMTLARIGQLAIVAVPAEFTTMAGRRLRETVAAELGESIQHVVLAGYSNDYTGYVTTKEEYDMQHYEGGHTLYGPWTLAAYQQEFTRLATAMRDGVPVDRGAPPTDVRGSVESKPLGSQGNSAPLEFGSVITPPNGSYAAGSIVEVVFESANPQAGYPQLESFLRVERQHDEQWIAVATDDDWATHCRWVVNEQDADSLLLKVGWQIPADAPAGIYRIGHFGTGKDSSGTKQSYTGFTAPFEVE